MSDNSKKKNKHKLFEELKEENVFSNNCYFCDENKEYYILISKPSDENPYSSVNLTDENMLNKNFVYPKYVCKKCFLK